ncbi:MULTISPECIES: hypothetical protein [unclassified Sphingomonas]|uniref:hypothetical protein n=1 Tax=unclassified Sphingomonas TaxID=196159 RepID=UPI002150FD38|nr:MULTISPECIES: hypothetical protein [unclassified Sphingomonas]MCR5871355.1 hypothetical protein [Sphingomonas sp. J344]UUY00342.1 hypothetical protein LRS08_04320 [Sphingomonas sp. J315]
MIGDLVAGYIGKRIDESDGEGGALGTLAGVAAWRVGKTVVPAAVVLGAAALGARYLRRRWQARAA